MLYLLDTSVCVALLRGRATETRLPEVSECALSVITVAELPMGQNQGDDALSKLPTPHRELR
jgi:predicted nucleic acid-binding protein